MSVQLRKSAGAMIRLAAATTGPAARPRIGPAGTPLPPRQGDLSERFYGFRRDLRVDSRAGPAAARREDVAVG